MNNREAMTIFENIESPDYEDEQKMLAIKTVTINEQIGKIDENQVAAASTSPKGTCATAQR